MGPRWLAFILSTASGLGSILFGVGIQVSDYENARLALGLMSAGALLLLLSFSFGAVALSGSSGREDRAATSDRIRVKSARQSGGQTAALIQNIALGNESPSRVQESDEVERVVQQLKEKGLARLILGHAKELASGTGPFDLAGERDGLAELHILGMVRINHYPGRPSLGAVQSVYDMPRDVYYLTDLGAKVVQRLRSAPIYE